MVATDTIHVKQMISLDQVAELTDTKIETLQHLNPSYKLDIIPVLDNKTYTLRLPLAKIGDFVQNEAQIYAAAKVEFEAREKPLVIAPTQRGGDAPKTCGIAKCGKYYA